MVAANKAFESLGLEVGIITVEIVYAANSAIDAGVEQKKGRGSGREQLTAN